MHYFNKSTQQPAVLDQGTVRENETLVTLWILRFCVDESPIKTPWFTAKVFFFCVCVIWVR